MNKSAYSLLADIEERHWWHQGRLKLIAEKLKQLDLPPSPRILDLGCGVGGTTRFLSRIGSVVGLDCSDDALDIARSKCGDVNFVKGDINHVDEIFAGGEFDLVTCLNVLYHSWISDEVDVLTRTRSILRPGGYVLLTEPAFRWLRRRNDTLSMCRTRYNLKEIRLFLAKAGFDFVGAQYFNSFSLPACLAIVMCERLLGDVSHKEVSGNEVWELRVPPRIVNETMKFCFSVETAISRWIKMPAGVTILAIGRA